MRAEFPGHWRKGGCEPQQYAAATQPPKRELLGCCKPACFHDRKRKPAERPRPREESQRLGLLRYEPKRGLDAQWHRHARTPAPAAPRALALLRELLCLQVFSSVPAAGGFSEALGVAFAPHWNASYTQDKTAVWLKPGPRFVPLPAQGVGNVEVRRS